MVYTEHSLFTSDQTNNASLWRYMDIVKFLHMLQTSSLFFSSLANLARFDEHEGLYTEANRRLFDIPYEEARKTFLQSNDDASESVWNNMRAAFIQTMDLGATWRRYIAVNSWHAEQHESAAMWKIYARDNGGLCVRTTMDRLKRSFEAHTTDPIYIGAVLYRNYAEDSIEFGNLFRPALHKRREFKYENEVRAVISRLPIGDNGIDFSRDTIGNGLLVKVDLTQLIEAVYVSPFAEQYFRDTVAALLERYSLEVTLTPSTL